jgi:hypothetical protein
MDEAGNYWNLFSAWAEGRELSEISSEGLVYYYVKWALVGSESALFVLHFFLFIFAP